MKYNHSISYSTALSIQFKQGYLPRNFYFYVQFNNFNWKHQVIMPQISWFHCNRKTKANFISTMKFLINYTSNCSCWNNQAKHFPPNSLKCHSWKQQNIHLNLTGGGGESCILMIYFLQLPPNILLFNTGSSEQSCIETHQVLNWKTLITRSQAYLHSLSCSNIPCFKNKVCTLHVFLKVSLSPQSTYCFLNNHVLKRLIPNVQKNFRVLVVRLTVKPVIISKLENRPEVQRGGAVCVWI